MKRRVACTHHRLQQVHAHRDIIVKVLQRIAHGFAHKRIRGKVQNGVGLNLRQSFRNQLAVPQVPFHKLRARIQITPMPALEVVKHRHLIAAFKKSLNDN